MTTGEHEQPDVTAEHDWEPYRRLAETPIRLLDTEAEIDRLYADLQISQPPLQPGRRRRLEGPRPNPRRLHGRRRLHRMAAGAVVRKRSTCRLWNRAPSSTESPTVVSRASP